MGIKKRRICKKVHAKKLIGETVTKNEVFDFYYCVQKFFWVNLLHFSTDSNSI
jgi:hypothetical protein